MQFVSVLSAVISKTAETLKYVLRAGSLGFVPRLDPRSSGFTGGSGILQDQPVVEAAVRVRGPE
eukprot:3199690-Lingulodinium_polyedra.AAC.1